MVPMERLPKMLLRWYHRHARRSLPWRKTQDPYAIWVSETMLQQTQVATVIPYYRKFLRRFPTVRALAKATPTQVLDVWSGLGYYRRAQHLHQGAIQVVREWNGQLPSNVQELRKIPGIGPYIAGAIASIAFGQPEPALDGNALRVFARIFGIREDPHRPSVQRSIHERLRSIIPSKAPGHFNQAVMDLGATICTPRRPRCELCPVASECMAFAKGWQDTIPPVGRPVSRKPWPYTCGILEQNGSILIARRPMTAPLPGLWEFPGGEVLPNHSSDQSLQIHIESRLGISVHPSERIGTIRHLLTHRELIIEGFRCRPLSPWNDRRSQKEKGAFANLKPQWYIELRWVPLCALDRVPLSAGMEKLARRVYPP